MTRNDSESMLREEGAYFVYNSQRYALNFQQEANQSRDA